MHIAHEYSSVHVQLRHTFLDENVCDTAHLSSRFLSSRRRSLINYILKLVLRKIQFCHRPTIKWSCVVFAYICRSRITVAAAAGQINEWRIFRRNPQFILLNICTDGWMLTVMVVLPFIIYIHINYIYGGEWTKCSCGNCGTKRR